MDEARIKALYRQATQAGATAPQAEDILAVLAGHGAPADEVAPLDRVAGSARDADIARTLIALEADIAALEADVAKARKPVVRPFRVVLRRSLALAAGVGAFAVLFSLLPGPGQHEGISPDALHESDTVIMSMSFEPSEVVSRSGTSTEPSSATIFRGNFDS